MTNISHQPRGFYLSASAKSSGKTMIGLGLAAALRADGYSVQAYKKGPDYIDPMWHAAATGKPCFNLDFYTQTHDEINSTFATNRAGAGVVYVEGNKGLFDGVDTQGSDSNAALAKLLDLPVVLVINASGITRGIAPLLLGYQNFTEKLQYAGVIVNNVAGQRHAQKLVAAIKEYTDFNTLGLVPKSDQLVIKERHLGLVPENEASEAHQIINNAAALIRQHVNLEHIIKYAKPLTISSKPEQVKSTDKIKIGIAKDRAFGFYYPDDLKEMERQGAQLITFNTLHDKNLPEVDALFIGGGFPEMQLSALQANASLRAQIKAFVQSNKPVYAECGGLMYLCNDIQHQGQHGEMVGAIDANVEMIDKPVGRGYAQLQPRKTHPWYVNKENNSDIACHEFHYSRLCHRADDSGIAYDVKRGHGLNGKVDGIIIRNMLANYCHQRNTKNNPWVKHFLTFIKSYQDAKYETN